MGKATILGITLEKFMMENGLEDKDMGMESGKISKGIAISENGGMGKL